MLAKSSVRVRSRIWGLRRPFLNSRPLDLTSPTQPVGAPDDFFEEDQSPDYDPTRVFPVAPGQLLYKRYKVLFKVGWGRNSTVWLARVSRRYVSRQLRRAGPF